MKRNRLITASMVVLTLTAASCGSSTPKGLSEDDFVSQMNAICRTADRAINKVDTSQPGYIDDISDIAQTGLDDLSDLKAPKALQADFDDFTANLDDQITQFGKLSKAIKNEDADAAQAASDKLDKLSADSDDLADSIGADKCVGVGAGVEPTAVTDPATTEPETTEPETTEPETTEPETTEAPNTTTVATPLPIDTEPDTVPVTSPSSGGGVIASDATTEFNAIDGFTWDIFDDIEGTSTPTDDPIIGPILQGYYVGALKNTANPDPVNFVYIYITVLNQDAPWTPEQLQAYYDYEFVGDGDDITTPALGLPGKLKLQAFEGVDSAAFTIPGFGVDIIADSDAGYDLVSLLDTFVSSQQSGEMPGG